MDLGSSRDQPSPLTEELTYISIAPLPVPNSSLLRPPRIFPPFRSLYSLSASSQVPLLIVGYCQY